LKLDPSAFVADPQLILTLQARSSKVFCKEEFVLFRQGETPAGLYILTKGKVTLTMDYQNGDPILSTQAEAGSVLGLPGVVGDRTYTLTATAAAGSELRFVTRDNFIALMQADPLLSLQLLKILAAEVRSARGAILHH
jgi:CRP-like cAMP-binding protein